MQIPVLRGRTFDRTDQPDSPHAALISNSLAVKYWPNEDPIGQTIQFGNMDGDLHLLHVVGVVGDVHDRSVDAATRPTVYANSLQRPPSSDLSVVVRAQIAPSSLVPSMREVARSLDPEMPVNFRTLDQVYSSSSRSTPIQSRDLWSFWNGGIVAGVNGHLWCHRVLGSAAHTGDRDPMALGARMIDVLKLVLRSGMSLALIGAAIGLASAFAVTRVMSSLLFGVTPTDLATFIAVPLLLLAVAFRCVLHPGAACDESRSAHGVEIRVKESVPEFGLDLRGKTFDFGLGMRGKGSGIFGFEWVSWG